VICDLNQYRKQKYELFIEYFTSIDAVRKCSWDSHGVVFVASPGNRRPVKTSINLE
jgi:hypothetical protein